MRKITVGRPIPGIIHEADLRATPWCLRCGMYTSYAELFITNYGYLPLSWECVGCRTR